LGQQRRGAGKPRYLSPSHRHEGKARYPRYLKGKIKIDEIIHNPGLTAPLAILKFDGKKMRLIAGEGMKVGDTMDFSGEEIKIGNVLPIKKIPEGTPIYNIEASPGDGGKFARSAGNSATIVSHGEKTLIKLPSKKEKEFDPSCRATIGIAAGGGRKEKPLVKAGKKFHSLRSKARRYPIVRGIAMNPVDHPHGGGSHQHVGKPSSVSRNAPPGRKVGNIAPKKTGKGK
jgi:large subunit ribosomal protein L2